MIAFLLLVTVPIAAQATTRAPCLPVASRQSRPIPSAVDDHQTLRRAIAEPMPQAATMIMLYGKGGHLSTQEYSIVVVRSGDGAWRGTAVGRSRIWVQDAPYSPMKRAEWLLDKVTGRKLDDGLTRRCPLDREAAVEGTDAAFPPPASVSERVDVVAAGRAPSTFYAEVGDGIATLIRPPR